MRKELILATAVAATLSAGCSTTGNNAAADDEKVSVTGSHIPRADRTSAGVRSTENKNDISDMMRLPRPATGGVVGAGGS